ncbi:unnamed protein product, partial [Symbiodinium necroappetens]
MATQREPGPGPIRKREWTSIAAKYLAGRRVILHTDGARAYKLKVDQVVHCNVVHKKTKVKKNGKVYWEKPRYTKIYDLMLPTGQKFKVTSGTQIIDRCWRHLRSHLQYTARAPGNPIMTRKMR